MKVFCLINRYIAILTTVFFVFCQHVGAQIPMPKHEVRAVWLTTIGGLDWPGSYSQSGRSAEAQQRELCEILDKLKTANVNTVLLQTRIRGTVIYPSLYEPWDGCLSGIPGVSPGYDALKFAIDECHKRGMELHAWVVTIPGGKWNKPGCKKLRTKYPKMIRRIGEEGYMNPECSETAEYLAKICREITESYDIDGIHLDYIRYPETWNMKLNREQGRRNITNIVRRIHDTVKEIKPWVKMSCATIGKYDDLTRYWSHGWNAYAKGCQDAQGWLRDGLMDELFPMMYFRDNQFFPFALDWQENSCGRIVAAGLGIYFMSPKEQDWDLDMMKRMMNVLRNYGMGHAYFRSKFFTDNTKGIYDFAAAEFDNYPALIPAMTWEHSTPPSSPTGINIERTYYGDRLSWSGAQDLSGGPYLLYNVYASTSYPVDINDARNLVATRYLNESIFIKSKENDPRRYYVVTAMDRYGNESLPVSTVPERNTFESAILLRNNGRTLTLPGKNVTLEADYLTIETLQGSIIATKRYDRIVDISNIPDGIYLLKSLGRKGVTHRIGFFAIKRKV